MPPFDPNKKLADYEAEHEDALAAYKGHEKTLHRIMFVASRPVSKKDRIERIKEICREELGE